MIRPITLDMVAASLEAWVAEIEEAQASLPHSAGLAHAVAGMKQTAAMLRSRAPERLTYDERLTVTGHNHMVQTSRSEEV